MTRSTRESKFLRLWLTLGHGPAPREQYQFDHRGGRRWRFDFAWPAVYVAVEIHGAEWAGGRHNRGGGLIEDCEKMRAAQLQGWIVLPFAGTDLDKRPVQVVEQIVAAIRMRGGVR